MMKIAQVMRCGDAHERQRGGVAARIRLDGAIAAQRPGCTPYCFGPTVDSDHSVGADPSTRCKSALMDGNGAGVGLCMSFLCGPLASTPDDGSVGFSTRRDDPSNKEFSSIDNDR